MNMDTVAIVKTACKLIGGPVTSILCVQLALIAGCTVKQAIDVAMILTTTDKERNYDSNS